MLTPKLRHEKLDPGDKILKSYTSRIFFLFPQIFCFTPVDNSQFTKSLMSPTDGPYGPSEIEIWMIYSDIYRKTDPRGTKVGGHQ